MLTQEAERFWTYEEPLRFLGFEIGRIMSVIQLSSGGLFIQSPSELTGELESALNELGEVRFVAPTSKLHGHLYMEQYREVYPSAELLAAPGLDGRRPDLVFDQLLGDIPDPRWAPDIDQIAILGNRWLTEIAFFHRPSRTVILGDFGYHIGESSPLKTRVMARIAGVYKQVGCTVDYRLAIRNNETFRRSIQDVLAWDFDRVIPGHGEIIEADGKQAVLDGFDWLL